MRELIPNRIICPTRTRTYLSFYERGRSATHKRRPIRFRLLTCTYDAPPCSRQANEIKNSPPRALFIKDPAAVFPVLAGLDGRLVQLGAVRAAQVVHVPAGAHAHTSARLEGLCHRRQGRCVLPMPYTTRASRSTTIPMLFKPISLRRHPRTHTRALSTCAKLNKSRIIPEPTRNTTERAFFYSQAVVVPELQHSVVPGKDRAVQ